MLTPDLLYRCRLNDLLLDDLRSARTATVRPVENDLLCGCVHALRRHRQLALRLNQCTARLLNELYRLLTDWDTRRKVRLLNDVLLLPMHTNIRVRFNLKRTSTTSSSSSGRTTRLHRLHL